jgi:hypothetical protein
MRPFLLSLLAMLVVGLGSMATAGAVVYGIVHPCQGDRVDVRWRNAPVFLLAAGLPFTAGPGSAFSLVAALADTLVIRDRFWRGRSFPMDQVRRAGAGCAGIAIELSGRRDVLAIAVQAIAVQQSNLRMWSNRQARLTCWGGHHGRGTRAPAAHRRPPTTRVSGRGCLPAGEATPTTSPHQELAIVAFDSAGHLIIATGEGGLWRWDISLPYLLPTACRIAGRNLTEQEWDALHTGRPYVAACP